MTSQETGSSTPRSAAERLVEGPRFAIDRLPVLHGFLEHLAARCTEGLRELCASPATFFVNKVAACRAWDALDDYEDGIGAIYRASEADIQLLIALDRRFIFSLIESIYGGHGGEPPAESDRSFSPLELRVATAVCGLAAESLRASFSTLSPLTLTLEGVENGIEFTVLGQRDFPVVAAQILLQVMDAGGRMLVLIPQSALHPVWQKLQREELGPNPGADPHWIQQLRSGIAGAAMELQATLDGPAMTLADIAALRVGQVLALRASAAGLIALSCSGERLFWCRLGQSAGQFTIVVNSTVNQHDELMTDVIINSGRG